MKVSKKTYYGLRAVLALAQVKKPLSIRSVALSEHLPEDYLEKILQALRRAGIVVAEKGATGGYALGKDARDISIWDIVRILDGPVKTFAPPSRKGTLPCSLPSHCQSNEAWRILEVQLEKTLSRVSLKDLQPRPSMRHKHRVGVSKSHSSF